MLAILYRVARNTPILLAANREEYFDRPTQHPKIQPGTPRVICGTDRQANGTWLGVNQFGLLATVTNRRKRSVPLAARSRGLLCRELLDLRTAEDAAAHAAHELRTGRYAGANYVVADAKSGYVVYGGDQVQIVELTPGLHTLSNGNLDDLQDERHQMARRMLTLHKLDSAVTFLAVASRAFSRKPDSFGRPGIVVPGPEFGTVSSSLLALAKKIQQSTFQYAPGPPSELPYEDLSALLRQVLSAGRPRVRESEGAGTNGAHANGGSAHGDAARGATLTVTSACNTLGGGARVASEGSARATAIGSAVRSAHQTPGEVSVKRHVEKQDSATMAAKSLGNKSPVGRPDGTKVSRATVVATTPTKASGLKSAKAGSASGKTALAIRKPQPKKKRRA